MNKNNFNWIKTLAIGFSIVSFSTSIAVIGYFCSQFSCSIINLNQVIIFLARDLYLVIIGIGIIFALLNPGIRKNIITLSIIVLPARFIVEKILDFFIYLPRPFVVEHVEPLIPQAATNSFPSGHTLTAMTFAALVFVYNKKLGIFLIILAFLVGAGRVLAKVHYPIDVVVAAIIAWAIVYFCRFLVLHFIKIASNK